MPRITEFLGRFLADECGISSLEYALILAFVGAGVILGAGGISTAVEGELSEAAACISSTIAGANC